MKKTPKTNNSRLTSPTNGALGSMPPKDHEALRLPLGQLSKYHKNPIRSYADTPY